MPDKVRMGVAICIPVSGRPVPYQWAFALRGIDPPINVYAVTFVVEGKPVDEARNWLVEQAQKNRVKYLCFIDEDTVVPQNMLRRFIFHMENNPFIDVVTGVYCSKTDPAAPLLFRGNGQGSFYDWKIGELFWITGCGMGCTLIRMSVFEKIEKPYFLTIKADGFQDKVSRSEAWTEDLYFLNKICDPKEGPRQGYSRFNPNARNVYCDGSILCDHYDVNSGKHYSLPWNSKPAVRRMAVGKKKILDLGCGEVSTIMKDGVPVRCDIRDDVNADYRCDIRQLPFASESFDVIFSSHTLEHFSRKDMPDVLEEWLRVLRPGGELRLIVPDLAVAAKEILEGGILTNDALNILYGAQDDPTNFHRIGFTKETLTQLVEGKGLKVEWIEQQKPLSLLIQAIKPKEASKYIGDGQGRRIQVADVPDEQKAFATPGTPAASATSAITVTTSKVKSKKKKKR